MKVRILPSAPINFSSMDNKKYLPERNMLLWLDLIEKHDIEKIPEEWKRFNDQNYPKYRKKMDALQKEFREEVDKREFSSVAE